MLFICFKDDDLSVNLLCDKNFFNQILWVASSKESCLMFLKLSSYVVFEALVHRSLQVSPLTNHFLRKNACI